MSGLSRGGRFLTVAIIVTLSLPLPSAGAATSAEGNQPGGPAEVSVLGKDSAALARPPDAAASRALSKAVAVTWPEPGHAEVTFTSAMREEGQQKAGRLPVGVLAQGAQRFGVRLHDRVVATRAGVSGLLFEIDRERFDAFGFSVDYSGMRGAFGGDWDARLRVVKLPACAVGTPERAECRLAEPVPGHNDLRAGVFSAETKGQHGVYALTAATGGSTGDFAPTSLAPSATWSVGVQSGEFSWSYPMKAPVMPGLTPSIDLSYTSATMDGRTAATNNQSSWVGDGFGYEPGFIERIFKPCEKDGWPGVADRCWDNQNAVVVLPGLAAGELVRDQGTMQWKAEHDNGWRIEVLTGTVNGDDDGEYWKATSPEGTAYFFGLNRLPGWAAGRPETRSALTVPVFGDDAGEPCHTGDFDTSWCRQAYRFNLDYVVDPNGNAMSYHYEQEVNQYGRNRNPSAPTAYARAATLARIDYGQRDGSVYTTPAPGRVVFTTAGRCLPGSACVPAQPQDFPDTPLDLQCDGASCSALSPSFFTTKRLAQVTAEVYANGSYSTTDSWALTHTFPATGDSEDPTLWLESIVRTGHAGPTPITLPAVNFDGIPLRNRVLDDEYTPMWKWRVGRVLTETGGQIDVSYALDVCDANLPASDTNTKPCYPVWWTPPNGVPRRDFMHKYVVSQVKLTDRVGENTPQVTDYEYLDGAAWSHDDNELTEPDRKDWGQWRGYARVRVRTGSLSTTRTLTEHRFLRGMDGDPLASGGRKTVTSVDSQGGSPITDKEALRGIARETLVYNGSDSDLVEATLTWPEAVGPTASRPQGAGTLASYLTEVTRTRTRTKLSDGTFRMTEKLIGYDNRGRRTHTDDLGDVSTSADDTCTTLTYAENPGPWLMSLTKRVQTAGLRCGATPSAQDMIEVRESYYDGHTDLDAPPARGNVTETRDLVGTTARMRHDSLGRVVEQWNALGHRTLTAYTPESGGPVTRVTTTNPMGFVSESHLDPLLGRPVGTVDVDNGRRTDLAYDALGRLTGVWQPGNSRANGGKANIVYEYLIRDNGPSAVITRRLQGNNAYSTSYELYDGFLRSRQTQAPSPLGGRIVTDTRYDSHGRVEKTNAAYHNVSAPSTTLMSTLDSNVPGQTMYLYDGAGRETAAVLRSAGAEKWRTTTVHSGDLVTVTPPAGGTVTTTVSDARGRRTQLRQHRSGGYDTTVYRYTKAGYLVSVTDPAGNVWRYEYDQRGNQTLAESPDSGRSTYEFDVARNLIRQTDARGRSLAFTYDPLGRKTGTFEGATAGIRLAEWTYDTLPGGVGLLTGSARFSGGNAYRTEVSGYDAAGRPTGSKVVIPAVEGLLAGTHETTVTYNAAGQVSTTRPPAAGGLPQETLTQGYNAQGLATTLTSALTPYAGLTYTSLAQAGQRSLGAQGKLVNEVYIWDAPTGRLDRNIVTRQGVSPSIVADLHYGYDPSGSVTRIADRTGDYQCFRTDERERVTQAWTPAIDDCATDPTVAALGGPAPYWHSYSYDVTGNRTAEVRHGAGGDITRVSSYPAPGQPRPHAVTSSGGQAFGYDAAGNLVSRGDQTFTWDGEGRLAASGGVSYLYDADGNRLLRRESGTTTLYLGDTELTLADGVVSGRRYYTSGGKQIAVRAGGKLTWLISDHHGTDLVAIDQATLAVNQRRTLPYGEIRGAAPASWVGERSFVGGTAEPTGLVHLGAREYDPVLGRFISVDPITDHDDPQQVNGYAYGNNNPVSFSDPDGLKAEKATSRQYGQLHSKPWHGGKRSKESHRHLSRQVESWMFGCGSCLVVGQPYVLEGFRFPQQCSGSCGRTWTDEYHYIHNPLVEEGPQYLAEPYSPWLTPVESPPRVPCGGWTQCLPQLPQPPRPPMTPQSMPDPQPRRELEIDPRFTSEWWQPEWVPRIEVVPPGGWYIVELASARLTF